MAVWALNVVLFVAFSLLMLHVLSFHCFCRSNGHGHGCMGAQCCAVCRL
jgi:hypothetical protein